MDRFTLEVELTKLDGLDVGSESKRGIRDPSFRLEQLTLYCYSLSPFFLFLFVHATTESTMLTHILTLVSAWVSI